MKWCVQMDYFKQSPSSSIRYQLTKSMARYRVQNKSTTAVKQELVFMHIIDPTKTATLTSIKRFKVDLIQFYITHRISCSWYFDDVWEGEVAHNIVSSGISLRARDFGYFLPRIDSYTNQFSKYQAIFVCS